MFEDNRDDHDRGLAHDLGVMATAAIGRRRAVAWLASAGAAAVVAGCGGEGSGTTTTGTTTNTGTTTTTGGTTTTTTTPNTTGSCGATPGETSGPYPADGSNSVGGAIVNVLPISGIVRQDIRSSFSGSGTVATGVMLTLTIRLVNSNAACAVLPNYAIYLWHCDAAGRYSLYDLPAENYLRGVQTTDANGAVTFTTIIPGCYAGRYPHMHFEVYPLLSLATGYRNAVLTSQLAMPSDVCTTVYATGGLYATSVRNFASVTVANDNVFGDNSAAQIAAMTPALTGSVSAGYTGTLTVAIAV